MNQLVSLSFWHTCGEVPITLYIMVFPSIENCLSGKENRLAGNGKGSNKRKQVQLFSVFSASPSNVVGIFAQGLTRLVSIAKQEYDQGDGGRIGDEPSAIQSTSVPVQDGDLIILGTDGLFDNVFDFEALALTGKSCVRYWAFGL